MFATRVVKILTGFNLVFFISFNVFAYDIEIQPGVEEALRFYTSNPSFSQAFTCGEAEQIRSNVEHCEVQCTDFYCMSECSQPDQVSRNNIFVEECSEDSLSIFGSNGLVVELKKQDYESFHNLWLIPFLQNMDLWISPVGKIQLSDAIPFYQLKRIVNGELKNIPAVMVTGQIIYPNVAQGLEFTVYLATQARGVEQILELNFGHDEVAYKLKGLIGEIQ
ncbi:MAG: hypothetical protein KDD50_16600 [Bdellovibrionales bacterium]|nr:hypothetical protein [Bdellovibrionales bacterium]